MADKQQRIDAIEKELERRRKIEAIEAELERRRQGDTDFVRTPNPAGIGRLDRRNNARADALDKHPQQPLGEFVTGAAQTVSDAFTANTLGHVQAAGRALPAFLGDDDFGPRYGSNLADWRAGKERFRAANPQAAPLMEGAAAAAGLFSAGAAAKGAGAALASPQVGYNIHGAVNTAGRVGRAVEDAFTYTPTIGGFIRTGAGTGAFMGGGAALDAPEEKLEAGLTHGGAGLVGGAAGAALGYGIGYGAGAIASGVRKLTRRGSRATQEASGAISPSEAAFLRDNGFEPNLMSNKDIEMFVRTKKIENPTDERRLKAFFSYGKSPDASDHVRSGATIASQRDKVYISDTKLLERYGINFKTLSNAEKEAYQRAKLMHADDGDARMKQFFDFARERGEATDHVASAAQQDAARRTQAAVGGAQGQTRRVNDEAAELAERIRNPRPEDITAAEKEHGVTLTPYGRMLDSDPRRPAQQAFEEQARNGGLGEQAEIYMRSADQHRTDQAAAAAERLATRLSGVPTKPNDSAFTHAGGISGAIQKADETAYAQAKALYRKADEAAEGVQMEAPTFRDVAQRIRNEMDELGGGDGAGEITGTLAPQVENFLARLDRLAVNRNTGAAQPVRLASLNRLRDQISKTERASPPDVKEQLRALKAAIDRETDNALERQLFSGDRALFDDLKAARAAWKDWKQRFFKQSGTTVRGHRVVDDAGALVSKVASGQATTMEVANTIIGASKLTGNKTAVQFVRRLKRVLRDDPQATNQVKRLVLDGLLRGPKAEAQSIQVMAKQIKEFTHPKGAYTELAREVFTPVELLHLRAFGAHLDRIPHGNALNPSGSGHMIARYAQILIKDAGEQLANAAGLIAANAPIPTALKPAAGMTARATVKALNQFGKSAREARTAEELKEALGVFGPPPDTIIPQAIAWGRLGGRVFGAGIGNEVGRYVRNQ